MKKETTSKELQAETNETAMQTETMKMEEREEAEELVRQKESDFKFRTIHCTITGILFLLVLILSLGLNKVQGRVDQLEQNVVAEVDTESIVDPVTASELADNYEAFAKAMFPTNGKYCIDENRNTFYADPDCSEEIGTDVRFISRKMNYAYDSDGGIVKSYLMDNGKIVYCPPNEDVSLWAE